MKDDFFRLTDLDDDAVEELSKDVPNLDNDEKRRIEELFLRKMDIAADDAEDVESAEKITVKHSKKRPFYPVLTAAAAILIAAGIANIMPDRDSPQTEESSGFTLIDTTDEGEKTTLRFSVLTADPFLKGAVKRFNGSQSGCRVEISEYGASLHYNSDDERDSVRKAMYEKYAEDVRRGNVDIAFSDVDEDTFSALEQEGAFAELTTFFDRDPRISVSDLDSHILANAGSGGGLTSVPVSYEIGIIMAPKMLYTDGSDTIGGIMDGLKNAPDEKLFAKNIFDELINGAVFDAENIRELSERCLDVENGGISAINAEKCICALDVKSIYQFGSYIREFEDARGDALLCDYGRYVSMGSKVAIPAALSEDSAKAAWEFVSYILGEEYQLSLAKSLGGLPVNTGVYNKQERHLIAEEHLTAEQAQMLRDAAVSAENVMTPRLDRLADDARYAFRRCLNGVLSVDGMMEELTGGDGS